MKGFLRRRKQEVEAFEDEDEEESTAEKLEDDDDSLEECCLWLCILVFLAGYPLVRNRLSDLKSFMVLQTTVELSDTITTTTTSPQSGDIKPTPFLRIAELVSNEEFSCKDLLRLTCKPPRLVTNVDYCGFNYLTRTEYMPKEEIARCMRVENVLRFKGIMLASIFTVAQNPKGGCEKTRANDGYHLVRFDNSLPKFDSFEQIIRLIGNHWLHKNKIPVIISRYKWKFENSSDHNFFRNINKHCNFSSIPKERIKTQTGHRNYMDWQKLHQWCNPGVFDPDNGVCVCPDGYGRSNGECVSGKDLDDGAIGEFDPFMIAGPMKKAECDYCAPIDFGPLRQNAVLTHYLLSDKKKDLKLFIARLRLAATSLAVHVTKKHSVDRYTEDIEQFAYKYKLHQVVLVGDDERSLTTIENLLTGNLVVLKIDTNTIPPHHAVWAIGSCNHFIGAFSESLSRLGFQLMVGVLEYVPPYISLDDPWCQTGIDTRKYPDMKYKMDEYICKPP